MAAILADAVLVLHGLFIVWVVLGGMVVLRWPRFAWLHIPAVMWGVWIELTGGICPLTPLEQGLRQAAGEAGYTGGFVEHYIEPLIYPAGLTRNAQVAMAAVVAAINLLAYALVWRRHVQRSRGLPCPKQS